MKRFNKIIALAFVLMMILAPVLACGELSDADNKAIVDSKNVKVNGFDDMSGGSIEVPIINAAPGQNIDVAVHGEDGKKYASTTVTAGDDGKALAKLNWNFGSSGDKTVYIYLDGTPAEGGIKVHVNHSIWKDPVTYVAIVVVILLIVLAVYLKMRGVPGKKKNAKTFTQIEEEKKSGEKKSFFKRDESKPAEIPKDDTTSTEKQEYTPGKGFFRKKQ